MQQRSRFKVCFTARCGECMALSRISTFWGWGLKEVGYPGKGKCENAIANLPAICDRSVCCGGWLATAAVPGARCYGNPRSLLGILISCSRVVCGNGDRKRSAVSLRDLNANHAFPISHISSARVYEKPARSARHTEQLRFVYCRTNHELAE